MKSNARNSKTIFLLVFSVSAAAGGLLLLESPTHGWADDGAVLDMNGWPIENLTIEVASLDPAVDPKSYDCAIMPDGSCYWQPGRSALRLAVIGPPEEELTTPQARSLLRVLDILSRMHGLDLRNVSIARQSDPAVEEYAAALNVDLHDLLVKKGVIQ